MSSVHFFAWKGGLKTGQYYLRSRPARDAIKFTVNMESLLKASDGGNTDEIMKVLSKDNQSSYNMRTKKVKPGHKKRKIDDISGGAKDVDMKEDPRTS